MYGKLTLCEYARVTNNGSHYDALGAGITRVEIPKFPTPIAFAVLVESKFSIAESGREYPFEVKIIDFDGKPAGPTLGGSIRVAHDNKGALYAAFNIQFIMKNPVSLSYSLLVNGEEKDCVCLDIKQGTSANIPRTLPSEKLK